jgi:hypothetical protein
MRWEQKTYAYGETRMRCGFLFLPKCIQWEWRWLERAVWTEQFIGGECGWGDFEWVNP